MHDEDEYEKNELEEVLEKLKRKYHRHMQRGGGGGTCCRNLNDDIMYHNSPFFLHYLNVYDNTKLSKNNILDLVLA
jgi:hypothetical protein